MKNIWLKAIISIVAIGLLITHLVWPERVNLSAIDLGLVGAAVLPWLSDLIKSLELPSGFKVEFQALQSEVAQQKTQIDRLTEFLFVHFVTEAELKHLEALDTKTRHPFDRASYFDAELRRLRSLGLIEGVVGWIPPHGDDLNEHMHITARGREYIRNRKSISIGG